MVDDKEPYAYFVVTEALIGVEVEYKEQSRSLEHDNFITLVFPRYIARV